MVGQEYEFTAGRNSQLHNSGLTMFAQIEKLKREYTDKYVVVAPDRPELARFEGHTGQVKTVNMSGRALVEFDVWASIGWYDIDLSFLRVVPKPEPKAQTEAKEAPRKAAPVKPAAKPAADSKPAGEVKPAATAEAAKPAGGKPSVSDVLAAARANKASAPAAPQAAPSAPAAKPAGAPPAQGNLSTAEILAAARTKKAAAAVPAETSGEIGDAAAATVEVAADASPAAAPPAKKPTAKPAASKSAAGGSLPTDTAGRIAWCREHDKM